MLGYIFNNYHDPNLNLGNYSCKLGLTKEEVENIFMTHTGNCFMGYLNEVRILQARSYLLDTDMTTEEIAQKVGYKSTDELQSYLEDDELNLL